MKNVIVYKLYQLENDPSTAENADSDQPRWLLGNTDYSVYKDMLEISKQSAEKYVVDVDEIIVHTGTAKNEQEMFKEHMMTLYNMLQEDPEINILYLDTDILFFDKFEIFNKFSQFAMTGSNCGARYYPGNNVIVPELWELMLERIEEWPEPGIGGDYTTWPYEQWVFQDMRMLQVEVTGLTPDNNSDITNIMQYPSWKHGQDELSEQWQAFHFHTSSNAAVVLEHMKKCRDYRERLGLDPFIRNIDKLLPRNL